jgi:hypothetical protein
LHRQLQAENELLIKAITFLSDRKNYISKINISGNAEVERDYLLWGNGYKKPWEVAVYTLDKLGQGG